MARFVLKTKKPVWIFLRELQSNPELQAYIIFYGGRCWSPCSEDYPDHGPRYPRKGEAETRAARIKPFLVDIRGLDPVTGKQSSVRLKANGKERAGEPLKRRRSALLLSVRSYEVDPFDFVVVVGEPLNRSVRLLL